MDGYGVINNAALSVSAGKIAWLGAMADLEGALAQLAGRVHSAGAYCLINRICRKVSTY